MRGGDSAGVRPLSGRDAHTAGACCCRFCSGLLLRGHLVPQRLPGHHRVRQLDRPGGQPLRHLPAGVGLLDALHRAPGQQRPLPGQHRSAALAQASRLGPCSGPSASVPCGVLHRVCCLRRNQNCVRLSKCQLLVAFALARSLRMVLFHFHSLHAGNLRSRPPMYPGREHTSRLADASILTPAVPLMLQATMSWRPSLTASTPSLHPCRPAGM